MWLLIISVIQYLFPVTKTMKWWIYELNISHVGTPQWRSNTKINHAAEDPTDTIEKRNPLKKSAGLLIRLIQNLTSALLVHAALQNKKNNTCARIGRTNRKTIMEKFDRLRFLWHSCLDNKGELHIHKLQWHSSALVKIPVSRYFFS